MTANVRSVTWLGSTFADNPISDPTANECFMSPVQHPPCIYTLMGCTAPSPRTLPVCCQLVLDKGEQESTKIHQHSLHIPK